jgi:FKBP-type peptidyl-prolyl cis-trans isomerase (trigger factor)
LSDDDKAHWSKVAERNVKLSFLLDKIREEEPEAQLTDQEVLGHLKRVLGNQLKDDSNEALAAYLAKMGHYSQVLFAKVKDEFALNFACKKVNILE